MGGAQVFTELQFPAAQGGQRLKMSEGWQDVLRIRLPVPYPTLLPRNVHLCKAPKLYVVA